MDNPLAYFDAGPAIEYALGEGASIINQLLSFEIYNSRTLTFTLIGVLIVLLITLAILTHRNRQAKSRLQQKVKEHKRSRDREKERLKAVMRSSARVNSSRGVEQTLDAIAMEAAGLLRVEGAGFYLIQGNELMVAAKYGIAQKIMVLDSIKVGDDLSGTVAQIKKSVVVANLSDEPRCLLVHRNAAILHKVVSYLAVPMLYNDMITGVLIVCAKTRHAFSRAEIALLSTLAGQAAMAIEKTRLYEGARRHSEELRQEIMVRKQVEIRPKPIRRSNEQILNFSGEGIYALDLEGRITFINPAAAAMIGWEPEEIIGKTHHEVLHCGGRDNELYLQQDCVTCNALTKGDVLRENDEMLQRKDGSTFPAEYTSTPIWDEGRLAGAVVNFRDISERKHAEMALQSSEQRLRVLYDNNPSIFFTMVPEGTILSVNPFGAKQLSYAKQELTGTSFFSLCHVEDVQKAKQNISDAIEKPDKVHRCEIRLVRKGGDLLWARESSRLAIGPNGQRDIVVVCEDITEAQQLSAELRHQATHDFLTGLVNRREFERRLRVLVDGIRENMAEHVLCYLDLDQFKLINDLCGHNAGDQLLKQLTQIFGRKLRRGDTLARIGGDEFGVLLENCTILNGERIAETLKEAVHDFQFIWQDKTMNAGVSIGLVAINIGVDRSEALLGLADAACYQAKQAGRNRIRIYRPTDTEELNRMSGDIQLRKSIDHALDKDLFQLALQPIVPVVQADATGEHYEVLLRLNNKRGGRIPTAEIIRVAEQYGFSTKIDKWVIYTVFEWLANRPEHLERLSLCFINLSGHSLGETDFLVSILDRLKATGIPPGKICFEITETAAIANFSNAVQFIEVLTKFGCQFSLDDFGSGLSSFAYLKKLPVGYIKIDGIFIKDLETDPISMAMVNSINEICHVTGKKTIAEFVENDAILRKLKEIGVDYAQGYRIGKPKLLTEQIATEEPSKKLAV